MPNFFISLMILDARSGCLGTKTKIAFSLFNIEKALTKIFSSGS